MLSDYYKHNPSDVIWWADDIDNKGQFTFSFDKKNNFNLFADYPHRLTSEQKKIFDEENPYWKNFFKERAQKKG